MTDNLPPLPKGDITYPITDSTMRRMECNAHSDSQMRAYARAAIDAALAARGAAVPAWELERMRHIANEWADMATNGLQFMRNIVDGISDESEALENLEKNLIHCRSTNDAPGAYGAPEAPQQVAQATTCKHCGGLGYTEKGGYQLPCICQMSADDIAQTINEMFASAQAKPEQAAQAKPEQAAQPNPLARRCYLMSEAHLSGHRLIIGFERLEDLQDAHAFLAAPKKTKD